MLKKLLASVGIGAAKVDAVLENEQLMPGETFRAEIIVKGGDVAQNIGGLNMALMTQAEVESDDEEYLSNIALQTWKVTDAVDLQPGEEKIIPFEATIHPETPDHRNILSQQQKLCLAPDRTGNRHGTGCFG